MKDIKYKTSDWNFPILLYKLRKEFGISQEEMAETIWIGRVNYANIELWNRNLQHSELELFFELLLNKYWEMKNKTEKAIEVLK